MKKIIFFILTFFSLLFNYSAFSMERTRQVLSQLGIVNPKFTIKNIEDYPKYKDYFIKYALDNFFYPKNEAILQEFKNLHNFIQIYPESSDVFAKKFIQNWPTPKNLPEDYFNYTPLIIRFIVVYGNDETLEAIANKILYDDQDPNYTILTYLVTVMDEAAYTNTNAAKFISILKKLINQMDLNLLLKNIKENSKLKIDIIFPYLEPEKQPILLKYFEKYLPKKQTFREYLETTQRIPKSLLPLILKLTVSNIDTQSKQHFLLMLALGVRFFSLTKEDIQFFLKIYAQEKLEKENGNYVFFHGRQWKWNYYSDIYKQLWNLKKQDHVGDSFQFLRFGKGGPRDRDGGRDILFMNSSIFGNLTNLGSSTAKYWLDNSDMSYNKDIRFLNTEYLFNSFGFGNIFKKYKKEFNELQKLHSKASTKGEILLISSQAKDLNNIYLTHSGGGKISNTDTKEMMDIIRTVPKKLDSLDPLTLIGRDRLEWALIVGQYDKDGNYTPNPYANDPHSGLIIYSFYEADPKIMEEYFKLRDTLFAKIKKDISAEKFPVKVISKL